MRCKAVVPLRNLVMLSQICDGLMQDSSTEILRRMLKAILWNSAFQLIIWDLWISDHKLYFYHLSLNVNYIKCCDEILNIRQIWLTRLVFFFTGFDIAFLKRSLTSLWTSVFIQKVKRKFVKAIYVWRGGEKLDDAGCNFATTLQ